MYKVCKFVTIFLYTFPVFVLIGYLMNIHKERGEGFNDLLELFVTSAQTVTVPYLEKKVHVLLTGKYKDCVVFANGNQWLPEKKMATLFKNLLGEEVRISSCHRFCFRSLILNIE